MRRLVLVIIGLVLVMGGAPRAWADEETVDADEVARQEIRDLVTQVARDARAGDSAAVARHVDARESVLILDREGRLEGVPEDYRAMLRQGLDVGATQIVASSCLYVPGEPPEIRRIWLHVDDRAEVYIRFGASSSAPTKVLWYLVRTNGAWKVYDTADLDYGVRVSYTLVDMLRFAAGSEDPGGTWQRLMRYDDLRSAAAEEDTGAVLALLDEMDEAGLPATVRVLTLIVRANCLLDAHREADALEAVDAAREIDDEVPALHLMRASLLVSLGRHEEALPHVVRYESMLAADADTEYLRGTVLARLDRAEEAVAAFERGLGERPDHPEMLLEYLRSLPAGETSRIRPYLDRIEDEASFLYVIRRLGDDVFDAADASMLTPVVEALRVRDPAHAYVDFYEGHRHRHAGRHGEAAAVFRRGWSKLADLEEQESFIWWYVEAMLADGRALEAWEEIPIRTQLLVTVASHLCERSDLDGLEHVLRSLDDGEKPPSPLVPYYEGWLAYARGKYAECFAVIHPLRRMLLETIAAGQETVEDTVTTPEQLLGWSENLLVRCLYRRGKGDLALKLAREIQTRDRNSYYVVLMYMLQGDAKQAHWEAMNAQFMGEDLADLLTDVDLETHWQEERFARLLRVLEPEK